MTGSNEVTSATPSKLRRRPLSGNTTDGIIRRLGSSSLYYMAIFVGIVCSGASLWIGMHQSGGLSSMMVQVDPQLPTQQQSREERLFIPPTSSTNNRTLALLYPPGLTGGYRNQVIRFFALVEYAMKNNMTRLYQPSLLWSTIIDDSNLWDPIPMDWVFDIGHWNVVAATAGLPIITPSLDGVNSDCWVSFSDSEDSIGLIHGDLNTDGSSRLYTYRNKTFNHVRRAAILQGGLQPIFSNITLPLLMDAPNSQLQTTRRSDYLDTVQHCKHPHVFGGGKRAGRLWNRGLHLDVSKDVKAALYRALRPAVSSSCVPHPYTALHARVELPMLHHRCGKRMEQNLENIVAMTMTVSGNESNLFIAVARNEMTGDERFPEELRKIGEANAKYFDKIVQNPHVYECGKRTMDEYYASHPEFLSRGSLLESAINFQIAVEADVFVGVESSSYSTDVLRARYFEGKRVGNYRYTKTGIEPVDGLVNAHQNCK